MKKLSYLLTAGVLIAFFAISGCKKKNDPGISAEDQAGTNFAGTWKVDPTGSVMFDTDDRTDSYTNFVLTVTYNDGQGSGTYTATGGPSGASPWPASGTWSFDSDAPGANSFTVTRDDDLSINVSVTETNLTLDFNFSDASNKGSRTAAVNGDWTFSLVQ